jgi:hypothetical protein
VTKGFGRPAVIAGLLVALALTLGCDRKPHLVPASSDSTGVLRPDSIAAMADRVRGAWEQGAADGSVAASTASLLLADLRQHPLLPLGERARSFLDSLSLGAEVYGGDDLIVVNFFSMSDPSGGSWPHLFWRDTVTVRSQAVEGSGMRLAGVASRSDSTGGGMQAAGLFNRSATAGPQPLVFVWRHGPKGRQWALSQTLGPDSLGGIGTAHFVATPGDSGALVSRTWQRNLGFEECPSCPHVYVTRRFRWGREGFSTISSQLEDAPYVAFVRLVQALTIPDQDAAREFVSDNSVLDSAKSYGLGERRGAWRLAPGGDEVPSQMTFFRGQHEAYRVTFARFGGKWRVSHIESTTHSIE